MGRLHESCTPILEHPEFLRLKGFPHHGRSIWHHSLAVTMVVSCLGRLAGMRERELQRGALLHDFFLYDWRTTRRPGGRLHGFSHPGIALENAERCFGPLSPLERDIILHHMWPLTRGLPRSPEAALVCAIDKAVAGFELLKAFSRARPVPRT